MDATVIIGFISIIAAYIFTQLQIKEMRNVDKKQRIIAIQSLVLELEFNKELVEQYKEHCTKGAHLGDVNNKEIYTWELISPNSENYKYLTLACYSDKKLAKEINIIYSGLEECRIIINQILEIWRNNLVIKENVRDGKIIVKQEIIRYNEYLLKACEKILNSFDNSISKLNYIKDSLEKNPISSLYKKLIDSLRNALRS